MNRIEHWFVRILEAVDAWEHDVQQQHVVASRAGHPERVLAPPCNVGYETVLVQTAPQHVGQLGLVLHDQDAHESQGGIGT